jgi:hypothetical protein
VIRLMLLSRPGCHLCDEMRREVDALLSDRPHEWNFVDVDSDADSRPLRQRTSLREDPAASALLEVPAAPGRDSVGLALTRRFDKLPHRPGSAIFRAIARA